MLGNLRLFGFLQHTLVAVATAISALSMNVARALRLADRAYVMDQGVIVHSGNAGDLIRDTEIQERYCVI